MNQSNIRHSGSRSPNPVEHNGERPGAHPYLTVTRGGTPVNLIAEARAAGRDNLPRTDSQQLSGPEDLIVSEHVRQHVAMVERTRGRMLELAAAFSALEDQLPTSRDLEAIVDGALARFKVELGDERLLVSERQEQQRGLRDLRHLVVEQCITRPARYPQSRRLHLAWVAALATAEAVGNAGFFAGISSIGWIGGLAAAIAIAALNTGSAVLVGYTCLRGLHHHRQSVRRLSTVGVAVYAALVLAFNLAVGLARDLATAGTFSRQTLGQLLRHPFDLSLLSAALVGLGLVAVAISLSKGRSLDDVIPDHGPLHRRFVGAEQHFARATSDLRRRAMADVEAVPGRLRAEVQRGGQLVDRLEATVVDTEKAIEAYESDRQHLETDSARLLRHFRGENERVRSTRPPGYFATLPQFPSQIDAGPVGLLNDRLTAVHQRFDALKDKAHRLEASQPERVQAATSRFEAFYNGQLRRADAGRGDSGDGADTLEGGQWS